MPEYKRADGTRVIRDRNPLFAPRRNSASASPEYVRKSRTIMLGGQHEAKVTFGAGVKHSRIAVRVVNDEKQARRDFRRFCEKWGITAKAVADDSEQCLNGLARTVTYSVMADDYSLEALINLPYLRENGKRVFLVEAVVNYQGFWSVSVPYCPDLAKDRYVPDGTERVKDTVSSKAMPPLPPRKPNNFDHMPGDYKDKVVKLRIRKALSAPE